MEFLKLYDEENRDILFNMSWLNKNFNFDKSTGRFENIDLFTFLENINSFNYEKDTNNTITVRKKSIEKLEKRILGVFHSCKNASDFELYKNLNLKISGCIYDNKQYGWLHFFGLIEDIELLHKLDWYVKKCFKQFKREYDDIKVKKFVKVYFQLKGLDVNKLSKNSYIPKFEGSNILNKSKYEVIKEFELDVDYYY